MDAPTIYDRTYERMHYAGREYLEARTDEELRALIAFSKGNEWIQDVAEEELATRTDA